MAQTTKISDAQITEALMLAWKAKKRLAEIRFSDFAQQAWHVVEPHTKLKWNHHHEAICDHIQATFERKLPDGVYTIPPRCTKSTLISVMAPAWWWINHPYERFLTASYDGGLATRDAVRSRRLMQSPWYQDRWSDCFSWTGDQNVKSRYENTKGGHRIAISVGGSLATGEGGDILIIDDAHSTKKSDSVVDLREKRLWFLETWYNRINDPVTGRRITVGQRVNAGDIPGVALSDPDLNPVVHFNLPMEFELAHRCQTPIWEDPRTKEGDILWPDHFTQEVLSKYRRMLGEYAYAGQYQQRPAPREGGLFKVENLEVMSNIPASVVRSYRSWDKAATQDGGARTAGPRLDLLIDGRLCISDMKLGQWSSGTRESHIRQTAEIDGKEVVVVIEQEPGSGGLDSARATTRNLAGFIVKKCKPTGDKMVRAEPLAIAIENGDVVVLDRPWTRALLEEMALFPGGYYMDQVDALAQGYNEMMSNGANWAELYPSAPEEDKFDGLGMIYDEDYTDEGDEVWVTA